MRAGSMTRRAFTSAGASVLAMGACATGASAATENVRHGLQIGGLGALRTSLPSVAGANNLTYDFKDFRDSTSVLLALEQNELDIGNITTQHLIRAISEGIPVVWVAGWGGGYNVLVARKDLGVKAGDADALKSFLAARKSSGKPASFGVPTGSLQHAELLFYLNSIGVNPDKDVDIANIPFPNHPRALEASEVDLAMTLSSFGAMTIDKGDGYLFKHLYGAGAGKQEVGFAVPKKLIKDRPDFVQRIVASHVQAMNMFMGKPDQQIAFEEKYSRLPLPVITMQERDFLRYNYRTNVADIKMMARELNHIGWVRDDLSGKVDGVIDMTFLEKATGLSSAELSTW
jgi:NitT/TauT family transport system substrate-binding protein